MLTLRDDAIDAGHPLHRLLGMLAGGPVHRLELSPLSRDGGAARWPTGTGRDADAVHALTRGNPFFVAEALAAPPDEVPASVKDAVLARVRLLSAGVPRRARAAVGAAVDDPDRPGATRSGALEPLAEAELAGLIELRAGRARVPARARAAGDRAVAAGDPAAAAEPARGGGAAGARAAGPRRGCCTTRPRRGDVETLLAEGPAAAREAARAGSHRQALAHFEAVVPHADRLRRCASARRCSTTTAGSSTTRTSSARRSRPRARPSGSIARSASRCRWRCAWCGSRATCSWPARPTPPRRPRSARWSRCDGADDEAALAHATLYLGAILALTPARGGDARCSSAPTRSRCARSRPDLAALCLNYLAIARVEAGEPDGLQTMRN